MYKYTMCALLVLSMAILSACGDTPDAGGETECNPEFYDCTPVVTPPPCDETKFDCTPTDPGPNDPDLPEVHVPTQDELRAIGVVFPGDAEFDELSYPTTWTAPSSEAVGDTEYQKFLAAKEYLYSDQGPLYCDGDLDPEIAAFACWYVEGTKPGLDEKYHSDWMRDYESNFSKITANEYFCPIGRLRGRSEYGKGYAEAHNMAYGWNEPKPTRIWRWHDHTLTTIFARSPESKEFVTVCVQTPYGAGWMKLEGRPFDVYGTVAFSRSQVWLDQSPNWWIKESSHPDSYADTLFNSKPFCGRNYDWIAFVRPYKRWDRVMKPYSYTAGTLAAQYVPTNDCVPIDWNESGAQ